MPTDRLGYFADSDQYDLVPPNTPNHPAAADTAAADTAAADTAADLDRPRDRLAEAIVASGNNVGIHIVPVDEDNSMDISGAVREGCVWVMVHDDRVELISDDAGEFRHTVLSRNTITDELNAAAARRVVRKNDGIVMLASEHLACQSMSSVLTASATHRDHGAASVDAHGQHHEHVSPVRRFMGLVNLDRRDIYMVVLFAGVGGVLTLATPLAVESLINVVSWGIYFQPLIVLGSILFACLAFAGVLQLLQIVVVEIIQRRQFARFVGDLSHRFARIRLADLEGEYPRESANRVFDVMTIQKASATLLLDGVTVVLTTVLGLVLLAFYHPYLLTFNSVLIVLMVGLTLGLGRGGIRTAVQESITKYRVVSWLQDVISTPEVFKVSGGEDLAVRQANQLTSDYIRARRRQFRVLVRQTIFAIGTQAVASTVVLAMGGYLVIDGQLTLGQLVATEFVITVVLGAFAKAGKSLEKYYDLMAGLDKVGHLLDYRVDPRNIAPPTDEALPVRWSDLEFQSPTVRHRISGGAIRCGNTVAVVGPDLAGGSAMARAMVGLRRPDRGVIRIGSYDVSLLAGGGLSDRIAYVGPPAIFTGTLLDNIGLGRMSVSHGEIVAAIERVGLDGIVARLPDGPNTMLLPHGYPLDETSIVRLMMARAIVGTPRLLILDRCLDRLDSETRAELFAMAKSVIRCTVIIVTNQANLIDVSDARLSVHQCDEGFGETLS